MIHGLGAGSSPNCAVRPVSLVLIELNGVYSADRFQASAIVWMAARRRWPDRPGHVGPWRFTSRPHSPAPFPHSHSLPGFSFAFARIRSSRRTAELCRRRHCQYPARPRRSSVTTATSSYSHRPTATALLARSAW